MRGSPRRPHLPLSRCYKLLIIPLIAGCADHASTIVAPVGGASLDRGTHDPGNAVTRLVSKTGANAGDCTSSPCLTIGYAVSQANAGDAISVAKGTYMEAVTITKRLALVGHDATIDATGQASPANGIMISTPASAGTRVSGFTVRNAGLEGIFVLQTSHVTIEHNTLVHNDAYGPLNPLCAHQPDDCGEAIHLQSVTASVVRGNRVHDNIGGILLTDENGPAAGNLIADNMVLNNTKDCGITLASHHFDPTMTAPAAPDVAGVYRNVVVHNTSNGNGAAGIGVFAGPPGAAAWGNTVAHNVASGNGEGGLMMHSHTPAQNIDGNVFIDNKVSKSGVDMDNPLHDATADISIASAVIPIPHTVVAGNHLSDAHYGIVIYNAAKVSGLKSNKFAKSIVVPVLRQ